MVYAVRSLIRRPLYTSTAVLVLGLAIGSATAVYALADAVLIRPLPLADQGRLGVVWAAQPTYPLVEISYPDFLDFRNETRAFLDVAAHGSTPWDLLMIGAGDPVKVPFGAVSGSFFDVLGAHAQVGRTLNASDETPAARVVVLSHALWRQRFGGDPAAVGRVISLDNEPYTIVGVMPQRFNYPAGSQLWAPLKLTIDSLPQGARDNLRGIGFLYMVGRLRPQTSFQQASADSTTIFQSLFERYRLWGADRRAVVTPLVNQLLGPTRPALLLLSLAAGLVLVLAFINVAGLVLVRASSAQSEIAVRYALGASARQIVGLQLAEAALIAGTSVLLAVPMAFAFLRIFVASAPAGIAGIEYARIGGRAIGFALVAGGVSAAVATLQAVRTGSVGSHLMKPSLAAAGIGRQVIIAAEVALTVTVLTAAGLAARSFWNLRALNLGYDPARVLLIETSGPARSAIRDALAGLPGVVSVGAVSLRPLTLGPIGDDARFELRGQTPAEILNNPGLNSLRATPGYFAAMGISLLFGRFFEEADVEQKRDVAIVSEATARALWGRIDVVGEKIRLGRLPPDETWTTIVGVVGSVRHRQVHEVRLDYYAPTRDASTWAVRTLGNPANLATAAKTALRGVDPGMAVETATLASLVSTARRPWQFSALLLTAFAVLALLLAATAVHGLVAYAVTLRTREFGIRMALGAQPRDIVSLVFQSTGSVAVVGIVAGVPASLAAARAMRSLLFEVSYLDPLTLILAVVILAIALVAACVIPSRRAALLDPTIALRAL